MMDCLRYNRLLTIRTACVVAVFLAGCRVLPTAHEVAISEREFPVTAIPPAPLPDFLKYVFPEPGARLSLEGYNTRQVGFDRLEGSAVCVMVNGIPLLEDGDDWDAGDVVSRTTIEVDGVPREAVGYIEDYSVAHEIRVEDGEGNLIKAAKVGGPYRWCVSTPLSIGLHRVDVRFEKSNAETISFAWTFELW